MFFSISLLAYSQKTPWENPNFHQLKVENQSVVILKDSVLIPESIKVFHENGELLSTENFQYQSTSHSILFNVVGNYTIEYYTYPSSFSATLISKDTTLIVEKNDDSKYYELSKGLEVPSKNAFNLLKTQGSLVRGLSFGNKQGASVQSSLDLILEGKLSENLNIKGHLADYNVPIEQGGYTQQINEFEDIFVEVSNKNSALSGGFLNLLQKDSYFANYQKKTTGIQIRTNLENPNSKTILSVAASLSRGEFYRVRIMGIEGNQGPYQLHGKNNERFIIIIPYSEHVYINGILIQRGIDKDYVINYNTGEITFNPSFLVTANQRIIVDFQYTSLQYNRFLVYAQIAHVSKKLSIQGSVYSETDGKNNPINSDLTTEDQIILSEAGNNQDLMVSSSAKQTSYDNNKILYKKTLVNNIEIYEYSTDNTQTLYQVGFSYVGLNKGNYNTINSDLNGKVYAYVPPLNGIPQGSYSPLKQLVAPQSKQVYSVDSNIQLNKGGWENNVALSRFDKNTYSSLDDNQNIGYAFRSKLYKNWDLRNWKVSPSIEYSFIQKNFYIIDRIKKIEFYRDFNISNEFNSINQNQVSAQLHAERKNFQFHYNFDFLEQKRQYNGHTQYINVEYTPIKTQFIANVLLHTDSQIQANSNLQDIDLSANRKWSKKNIFTVGFHSRHDQFNAQNQLYYNAIQNRMYYAENSFNDSLNLAYKARIYYSTNDTIRHAENNQSRSTGFLFSTQWKKGIDLNMHFRNTHWKTLEYNNQEKYLLSNLHLYKTIFKDMLNVDVNYALGSGTEPQRAFQYVKVSDGNGIYKWTDYNGNGTQEIEEFEIAEFQDLANYIRVYTETVKYLKTAKNQFSMSLNFNPSVYYKSAFSKRWRARATFNTEASYPKKDAMAVFNPFQNSDLMYQTQSVLGILQFNSLLIHKYEWSYKYTELNNFRNNYLGRESLNKYSHILNVKNKLTSNIFLENQFTLDDVNSYSENLAPKNYHLKGFSFSPSLNFTSGLVWEGKFFYSFKNKRNLQGIEKLKANELGFSMNYHKERNMLLVKLSWVDNKLIGQSYSLVSNQMMQGLKTGTNWVWSLNWQNELAKFLFLNLQYEGRKNQNNKSIHIGNVQVKLVF